MLSLCSVCCLQFAAQSVWSFLIALVWLNRGVCFLFPLFPDKIFCVSYTKVWKAWVLLKVATLFLWSSGLLTFPSSALSAWHSGGAWEEAHLSHHHSGFPPVLRRGVPDQTGQQPHRARGRGAEQHRGPTSAGCLPRRGTHQENSCWPPGRHRVLVLFLVTNHHFWMENQHIKLIMLYVVHNTSSKSNKRKRSMQKSKQVVKLWVFQLVQSLVY